MIFKIVDSNKKNGFEIMRIDEKILRNLDPGGPPILHIYDWASPTATYGCLANPKRFQGIDMVRRITGGGVAIHLWDISFSIFVPKSCYGDLSTMERYFMVNEWIKAMLMPLAPSPIKHLQMDLPGDDRFCFGKPTKYDLVVGDSKLVGAAQRATRNGFLHHGSISLVKPDFLGWDFDEDVKRFILKNTYFLPRWKSLKEAKEEMSIYLQEYFSKIYLSG